MTDVRQLGAPPRRDDLAGPAGRTLIGAVAQHVARRNDTVAVRCGERTLSWRELGRQSDRLAARLAELGLGSGAAAGIRLPRSPEFVIAMLAVLKTGACYVPLPLDLPAGRLQAQLRQCGARLLIVANDDTGTVDEGELVPAEATPVQSVPVDVAPVRTGPAPVAVPIDPQDPAYVIFTSGSTGQPKGVVVSHGAVLDLVADPGLLPAGPADRVAQVVSVGFDPSVLEIWTALLSGAELVVVDDATRIDPVRLRAEFARAGITLAVVPTPLLASFTEPLPEGARPLRQLLFGGAAADPVTVAAARKAGVAEQYVNAYGPTETTVVSTYHVVGEALEHGVPIGRPRQGLSVYVLDRYRQLVPVGVRGEIYVGGHGLALGYVNDPERTAERFVPDPFGPDGARLYRTGDIGRLRPDGTLEFIGRSDEQVKIRGHRVEPGEVRSVLSAYPDLREVEVLACPAPSGARLVAYYTSVTDVPAAQLRRHLSRRLPEYMIPAGFVRLDAMPLTSSGKVDRRALPAWAPTQPGTATESRRPPATAAESPRVRTLQAIWADVLGLAAVDPDADFFDLGGDSLSAVAVTRRAAQAGIRIPVGELLRLQTLRALDDELAEDELADRELPAAAGRAAGTRARPAVPQDVLVPYTPIQRWFFDQPLTDHAGYVSIEVFESAQRLDPGTLRSTLHRLALRHDALRAHRSPDPARPGLVVSAADDEVPLTEFGLAEAPAVVASMIESIDLGPGRVWRVGLCDRGPDQGQLVVLLAHHVVVDAVSFAILAQDLEQLHRTGSDHAAPADSWAAWARGLNDLAVSGAFRHELAGWAEQVAAAAPLPGDRAEPPAADALCWRHARLPLARDPSAVILASLARTMAARGGAPRTLVDVQHHGRVELPGRPAPWTGVGWYTSMSPVAVDAHADPRELAAALRARPLGGLGYGLLRHLDPDPAVRDRLSGRAGVLLNYRGRRGHLIDSDALLRIADDDTQDAVLPPSALWRRLGGVRGHDLEIIAETGEDTTMVSLGYSANQLDATTAAGIVEDIGTALAQHAMGAGR